MLAKYVVPGIYHASRTTQALSEPETVREYFISGTVTNEYER